MEHFKVTGDDLRGHYKDQVQLKDVFRDIEAELKAERRVVCQYIVNGMTLEERDEARFSNISLEEVTSLEYLSEKTDILLLDVLDGWLKAIPELQQGAEALAKRLRRGDAHGHIKALYDLVENCDFLVASLNSARRIMGDAAVAGLENYEPAERKTKSAIKEALRHLESKDFVQLGLVIEYDLNHSLEEWAKLLRDLRQRLGAAEVADHENNSKHSVDRRRISN